MGRRRESADVPQYNYILLDTYISYGLCYVNGKRLKNACVARFLKVGFSRSEKALLIKYFLQNKVFIICYFCFVFLQKPRTPNGILAFVKH